MSIRLSSSYVVIPAVMVAAGLALYGLDRAPVATAEASAPVTSSAVFAPAEAEPALPPNHPPIRGTGGARPGQPPAEDEAPAIVWTAPAGWKVATSPNTMRLATYRAPGGVEVSVARAGGATEANIQRWIAQFDDVGREARAEKTVHGLHVVTVDMAGTYVGGGASMGGPEKPERDWSLVGAIVESRGPAYFFKMTGPAAAVRAARSTFDLLLDGVSPT